MKRVILLSVSILLISLAYSFAEVPCKINYQGRLIENNVPVDGTREMRFTIYDSAAGGNELWTSGEVDVTVYNGLFRYVLGSDGEDLSSIPWTAGETLYLEVEVGEDILTPREAIYAYPYAINSHLLEGETKEYFLNTSGETQTKQGDLNIMGNVGIGTTDPQGYKLYVAGDILSNTGKLYNADKDDYIEIRASDESIRFFTQDAEKLTILNSGNVGIGRTSPGAKLEVDGDILSDTVGYDSEGAYRYCKINGNKTKVYTKYLTGTLDADDDTAVAHGVTAANIVSVSCIVCDYSNKWYYVGEIFHGTSTDRAIYIFYNSTDIRFRAVGPLFQGQAYRIRIDYTL